MKVILIGYGKMGQSIYHLLNKSSKHQVIAIIDHSSHIDDDLNFEKQLTPELCKKADVAIEFTKPEASLKNIKICLENSLPVVVGTTGWYQDMYQVQEWVDKYSGTCIWAENFAVGVQLFMQIVRQASSLLNSYPSFDIAIHESHHNQKLDAPSGTAYMLAKEVISQVDRKQAVTSASNDVEDPSLLQISSSRIGFEVGTHSVAFDSENEVIELIHRSRDRTALSQGAIYAAEKAIKRKGLMHFSQLLNQPDGVCV